MSNSAEARKLIDGAWALVPQLSEGGFISDRDSADPTSNFALLGKLGIQKLLVPTKFGGLWDGTESGQWRDLIEAQVAIGVGDGSTAQTWGTTGLVAREIFDPHAGLPESTLTEVAERILRDNLRMCAANAVIPTAPATAERVEGGIVLSGSKSFVTNSGGMGIANVGLTIDGVPHHALVELTDPKIVQHHDWDNMGQRGTYSQRIDFDGVFVRDGWFFPAHAPSLNFVARVFLLHAALNHSIGEGAFQAMLGYVREMKRGSLAQFATPAEDPLMKRRIGDLSASVAASRALLYETSSRVEGATAEQAPELIAAAMSSKLISVSMSLQVSNDIFDLTGARSTANTYRFDRYWRNARTFGSHDPYDAKAVIIGGYDLTGEITGLGFN